MLTSVHVHFHVLSPKTRLYTRKWQWQWRHHYATWEYFHLGNCFSFIWICRFHVFLFKWVDQPSFFITVYPMSDGTRRRHILGEDLNNCYQCYKCWEKHEVGLTPVIGHENAHAQMSAFLAIISAIFTKLLQLQWSKTDNCIWYWDSDSVSAVADDEEPWCCVP